MEPLATPPPAAPPPMGAPIPPNPTGTGYPKVDLGNRFIAALIDSVIAGVLSGVLSIGGIRGYGFGLIVGAAYILVRDGLAFDFADGRSIGKKVMKLRPVRLDGGAMDIETSIRRNWTLAAGLVIGGLAYLIMGWTAFFAGPLIGLGGLLAAAEAFFVYNDKDGRRFGDKFANTQVIDAGA